MKKHKLLFVNPYQHFFKGENRIAGYIHQPLAFGILAALTPKDLWDIEFVDELFEEFTYRDADLVAMTSLTSTIPRAYEIAAVYKEHGIPVVLGGVHAHMMPDEAMQYVDVVARGEAEYIWRQILDDCINKNLQKIYEGGLAKAGDLATPDHSIFDKYPYPADCIYFSRGCPMGCEFCSVTALAGASYRERPVDEIVEEFASLKRYQVFVIDDHLVNNTAKSRERAQELFTKLVKKKVKKSWTAQAAVNIGDDENLVKLISKAGCRSILIGFEAETEGKLKTVRKSLNIKRTPSYYDKILKTLNKNKITVIGAFIFCLENDTLEDLHKRHQFVTKHHFNNLQLTVLTPLPGTVVFDRIKKSGQLDQYQFPRDWEKFSFSHNLLDNPHATKEEMHEAMKKIYVSVYSKETIRRRMFRTLRDTRDFETTYGAYTLDFTISRMFIPHFIKRDDTETLQGKVVDENFHIVDRKPSLYMKITNLAMLFIYTFKWNAIVKIVSKVVFEGDIPD